MRATICGVADDVPIRGFGVNFSGSNNSSIGRRFPSSTGSFCGGTLLENVHSLDTDAPVWSSLPQAALNATPRGPSISETPSVVLGHPVVSIYPTIVGAL